MKKYGLIALAFIAACCVIVPAFAGLDVSGEIYTTIAAPTSVTNGTTATAAVNVAALKGNGKIIIFDSGDIGATATTQAVVTVQHSTTGTSAWANVTAPTFGDITTTATVEAETVDTQTLRKYLRLNVTIDGTNSVQHYIGGVIVTPR